MYNNDQIVDGLLHNDQLLVIYLYQKNYPVISNWICRNNGSKEDADDTFQEALLIIINKIREDGLELNCSFSTYLFSVCKHLWFHELRIRKKLIFKDSNEFSFMCFEEYDDTFEKKQRIFLRQISRLEIKCQKILLLCSQNKSLSQIMKIMKFKNAQAAADKKKNCRKALIRRILSCDDFKQFSYELSLKN